MWHFKNFSLLVHIKFYFKNILMIFKYSNIMLIFFDFVNKLININYLVCVIFLLICDEQGKTIHLKSWKPYIQSWTKPVNKTRRYVHFCSIFINTCASRHIGPLSPRNNVALMGLYCGDDESNIEWGKGGQNVEYNLVNAISLWY
jgi:hypothetical protein